MPTALSRPWSSNYTPSTGNSGYQQQTCTSPSSSSSSFISQGGNLINWRGGGGEEMIQLRAHLSTLLFSSSSANSYLKYHYSDWPLPVKEQQEALLLTNSPSIDRLCQNMQMRRLTWKLLPVCLSVCPNLQLYLSVSVPHWIWLA